MNRSVSLSRSVISLLFVILLLFPLNVFSQTASKYLESGFGISAWHIERDMYRQTLPGSSVSASCSYFENRFHEYVYAGLNLTISHLNTSEDSFWGEETIDSRHTVVTLAPIFRYQPERSHVFMEASLSGGAVLSHHERGSMNGQVTPVETDEFFSIIGSSLGIGYNFSLMSIYPITLQASVNHYFTPGNPEIGEVDLGPLDKMDHYTVAISYRFNLSK